MLAALWIVSVAGCGTADPVSAPPSLNGCTAAMFVDRTAASASRSVDFGGVNGSGPFAYLPKCIIVSAGQTVTFTGDFTIHPLAPGVSPAAADAGTAGNPIPSQSSNAVPSVTVTFPRAGEYPYICVNHYLGGMVGVVRVR